MLKPSHMLVTDGYNKKKNHTTLKNKKSEIN